jgi:hypothetical protein
MASTLILAVAGISLSLSGVAAAQPQSGSRAQHDSSRAEQHPRASSFAPDATYRGRMLRERDAGISLLQQGLSMDRSPRPSASAQLERAQGLRERPAFDHTVLNCREREVPRPRGSAYCVKAIVCPLRRGERADDGRPVSSIKICVQWKMIH